MKEYRELFLTESSKHLARIEALLDGRDHSPQGGVVEALFREVHSYKGMAGTMRFDGMSRFAHRLEDMLDGLRVGGVLGEAERSLLFRALDRLSAMRENVAEGGDGEADWSDLFPLAGNVVEKPAQAAAVDSPAEPQSLGGKVLSVTITIDPDCPTPAARAYLVVSRFKELAPDLESEPALEKILAGGKVARVRLTLPGATRREVADIYDALTEVASLAFDDDAKTQPSSKASGFAPQPKSMLPEAVEVESSTLDNLVDMVGELTLMSARIRQLSATLESDPLRDEARKLESMVRGLDDSVMAMRCFPFSTIAGRLRRFVREEGEKLGKKTRLSVSGGQIGVDKAVMMRLSAPLTHLLRNALDHGLETSDERLAAGKSEEGTIEINLERGRNMLKLVVADDGRGVDLGFVARVAVERGLAGEEEISTLGEEKIFGFLFMPGFSTRDGVGELSGRGVGLDAVLSEIAAMGGEIRIESEPGSGTRFTMELPVSPAIAPALTLEAGGLALALPVHAVSAAFEASADELEREGAELLVERDGERIPVVYLSDVAGSGKRPDPARLAMVVVAKGGAKVCLAADRLLREEYLFVKPFKGMWEGLSGLSGYSVKGDGGIVYLLDVSGLLRA